MFSFIFNTFFFPLKIHQYGLEQEKEAKKPTIVFIKRRGLVVGFNFKPYQHL